MKLTKKRALSTFSKNIRHLRAWNGYSLSEIAVNLQLKSRYTYYSWERGDSEPSIQNIIKIAKLFQVSIDDLLTYEYKIK